MNDQGEQAYNQISNYVRAKPPINGNPTIGDYLDYRILDPIDQKIYHQLCGDIKYKIFMKIKGKTKQQVFTLFQEAIISGIRKR